MNNEGNGILGMENDALLWKLGIKGFFFVEEALFEYLTLSQWAWSKFLGAQLFLPGFLNVQVQKIRL